MIDTSKIIHAPVGGGRYTVTAPIVKEDYGLYLLIEGLELPSTYEVDFSNSEHNGTSVTMIGNSDGVLIPSQFISSGKDVFAFLYHAGDNYGRTVFKFRIPNKLRPDRTDEQPTPEEQSTIDQAISALNSAVAQTAQDVIDADASAQSAQGYAEQAEGYAENASTSATEALASETTARSYANSASASATASAQSAEQSAINSADAQDSAEEAQGYAQASAQSATASANSASQASGYAQSASASASSAQGYASQAQTSAQTASAKAQEASTSASTAGTKATESAQSATNAQGYAQTAEQAKTASQTAQGLAESARDSAVSAKTDAESARDDAVQAKEDAESAVASISDALDDKAPVITDTASGAIASFSDGADDLPLKSLVVNIDPVQDLHGQDSPYSAGGGKNKFDPSVYSDYLQSDGKYRAKGSQINPILIPIPSTLLNTACTFSFYADMTNAGTLTNVLTQAVAGGTSKNGNLVQNGSIGRSTVTFTPTSESDYIRITFGSNGNNEFTFYNVQLEASSAATDYAPYENICPISGWTSVGVNHSGADMTNPTTITISLGQTVYGGKLDVLSGKLVVDRAMVDLGTLNWSYDAQKERFKGMLPATSSASISNPEARTHCLCSIYKTSAVAYNDANRTFMVVCVNTDYVWLRDNRFTDAATFKTAMSGVQLCYELAEPIEVQLSANQINSLYGVNNIFAYTGDCEVEYRADTKLYIEKLTQPEEDDMIADSAITSGQFFMVGNTLYRALANIASGATITVGTNAQRVSLADALNLVNA